MVGVLVSYKKNPKDEQLSKEIAEKIKDFELGQLQSQRASLRIIDAAITAIAVLSMYLSIVSASIVLITFTVVYVWFAAHASVLIGFIKDEMDILITKKEQ